MSDPAFLHISRIACEATNSLVGTDELEAVLGLDRFPLGKFRAGTVIDGPVERAIALGVAELVIQDAGLLSPTILGRFDLTQNMDTERVVAIFEGSARYDLTLIVASEPG